MGANLDLYDSAVRHAVFMERFKSASWRRVVAFLNQEVFPDLLGRLTTRLDRIALRGFDSGVFTTNRYRDMVAVIDDIIRVGLVEARRLSVSTDLLPLARREAAFAASELRRVLPAGIGLDFVTPDASTLRSIVTTRPMQGKLLREMFDQMEFATRKRVRSQVSVGLAQGESTEQIVRRLRGTRAERFTNGALQATRTEATRITRTAVNHVVTHAREATYSNNDDIIKGVRYVATLDNRTTFQCASLDGTVWDVGDGPRPPVHMQCRSTTTPILRSWKELGIDLKEAPPGTRESLDGQVPATETYQAWLFRQPRSVQRDILGPGRLRAFDEGRITSMRELLGPTGQPLTLDQLFGETAA